MAIFKYNLPSGASYVLEAPANTTQSQADYVFYNQIASGSLVGYTKGQTLTSLQSQVVKFGLSRLDRETAGVDIFTVLAITSGNSLTASVPNLLNVGLKNPITPADVAQITTTKPLGVDPVGPLSPEQTQSLLAQIQNLVDQPSDTVSSTNGVGSYGLGPDQLENAGYLKPGTSNYPDFNCVVGTPSVWTGKNGVYSLADVANDPGLQTAIQTAVMQNSYNALVASGTIQTTPTQPASLSTGKIYTNAGVLATLTAPALITGTAALTSNLNSLISRSFAGTGANVESLLSNPVSSINTIASGAVNSITQSANALANNVTSTAVGIASGITNSVNGAVGALVTNASQFGSTVTAAWAQGSAALGGAINALNGGTTAVTNAIGSVTNLAGQAQSLATGAVGSLTNLASGTVGALQGQAQALLSQLGGSLDVFGKMSQFSLDFSLFSSDSLVSTTKVAAGFSNTVNRQTVDAALTRILGNSKIPVPTFEFPNSAAAGAAADIAAAQTAIKNLVSSGQQIATNVQSTTSSLIGTGQQLVTNVQSTTSRLIG